MILSYYYNIDKRNGNKNELSYISWEVRLYYICICTHVCVFVCECTRTIIILYTPS